MRAGDQGKPENFGETNVNIVIDRDDNAPRFIYDPNLSNYYARIEETRTGIILQVRAVDDDNEPSVSCKYISESFYICLYIMINLFFKK